MSLRYKQPIQLEVRWRLWVSALQTCALQLEVPSAYESTALGGCWLVEPLQRIVHTIQVQASSGAEAVRVIGRSVDDQSEITFVENDNSTILAQIQQIADRTVIRHRVGYIRFDTGGVNEKMRLESSGDLHLKGSTDQRIRLNSSGAGGNDSVNIRGDGNALKYNTAAGTTGLHIFENNGNELMRIDSIWSGVGWGDKCSYNWRSSTLCKNRCFWKYF